MCKAKHVLSVAITLILISLTIPAAAFATIYDYDYGRTRDLTYADDGVYYADRAWSGLGFAYESHVGSTFTESRAKANLPLGNGFYVYTHGNADAFLDNNASNPPTSYSNPGVLTRADVTGARAGDWKRLVFLDFCNSSDDARWASAFGIAYGDGYSHASLGWTGTALDNATYSSFDNWFWWSVQNYSTISASANYAAYRAGGATNWLLYGNGLWHY